jgi:release factor glutamine methyltransferase
MYVPSDDTFLLAECIANYHGIWALEIGAGSGVLLNELEKNFENVAASDISLRALENCKQIISSKTFLVCCDAASAFIDLNFDLIVSNPPYLPNDEDDRTEKDLTIYGGPSGIETTVHFVQSALPLLALNGKILLIISSLANTNELDRMVAGAGLHKKVIKERKLFFEMLSVVELSR